MAMEAGNVEFQAVEASTALLLGERIEAALDDLAERTGGGFEVQVEYGVLKDRAGAVTGHLALLIYEPPAVTPKAP